VGRHPDLERSGEPEGGDKEMGRWGEIIFIIIPIYFRIDTPHGL